MAKKNNNDTSKATKTTNVVVVRDAKSGAFSHRTKSVSSHRLNVPMDKSQMSKSDKATVKAWKYSYANREKRVD